MQGVGLQCVARIFSRHASQGPRPRQIDGQSDQQHQDRGDARLDVHAAEEEAVKRLVYDVESGQRQKPGLDECRKVFEFAVPVRMPLIRRLVGHAYGKKCDDRGKQVEAGMQRLREDA